ncbi:hypothetical protein NLA06_03135 [Desulfomicrobium sp. ZS1]|uniref:hypothetical protein n=1 Tax=Desulfomicrobium sp. ZS1 TaxID=2952228 RepID=UPI0020B298A6|nr:hypothetical protein [Desulfomicrobium sp. ZS1]UTF50904.1 hypothetical protein NLA06_03135 [Desulfomicrobium sp. ZS1]
MTTNELRTTLAQAELQAVHAALVALADHVAHWTPEKMTADPDAAYKGLDLVSTSMTHVSERVDRAMDLVKPEEPQQ